MKQQEINLTYCQTLKITRDTISKKFIFITFVFLLIFFTFHNIITKHIMGTYNEKNSCQYLYNFAFFS